MEQQVYSFTEDEWQQINAALLMAVGICSVSAPDGHEIMFNASLLMDDIANREQRND